VRGEGIHRMASIYLAKRELENGRRTFHLGDKPFDEIIGQFGIEPENNESIRSEHSETDEPLGVIVSVGEDEIEGTGFQAGYYRAAISPHHAMRHCGLGLSDILGSPKDRLKIS
jgi:hypothetical protein